MIATIVDYLYQTIHLMNSGQEAYIIIKELVERFAEQIISYKKSDYNEPLVRKIGALVYELYGLSEDEIKIVEGNKLN